LSALLATSALATSIFAFGAAAQAAEAETTTAAATAESTTAAAADEVDAIVVTGALRTQRLQDVPMAVTSVPASEFTNAGFKEPRELQFLSPSIQVSIQGANAIYIRGSGTNSQNGGTEQSVGLVIDGVLQGFVDDIGGDISDLDHIEVYRGPQGTQFAKNASAGVVSMTNAKPKLGVFEGKAHFSYGEHRDTADSVTVNVPISDTLAARFTAGFQHRDGVFENVSLGQKQGGREQKSLMGKLLWKPSDDLSVLFSVDARRVYEKPNFPQAWAFCGPPGPTTAYTNLYGTRNLPPCNGALTAGITPSDDNSQIVEADDAFRHTEAGGASLQVEYKLGTHTLTSISAYRFMSRHFIGPGGSGVLSVSFLNNAYSGYQLSQEFRIASPADQKLSYVGGVFLYKRDTVNKVLRSGEYYGQAYFLYPNTPYGRSVRISGEGGKTRTVNVNKSYAAFVDGTYHFTDKLQLNAGFRVTHDDVTASVQTLLEPGVYPIVVGGALKPPGFESFPKTGYTYRVGPQYFITPDIQVYGTFAHGYKGPLIDTTVNVLNKIKPEEVDMFELGLKSSWWDHRITLNVTGFHQKFTNYQVNVLNQAVTPSVFQLGNAGGMLSKGVEVESSIRPTDDWLFTAGFTYNESHYTDFATSCWNAAEPIKQATTGDNGCWIRPGTTAPSTNAKGTPLVNNSKFTYRVAATYTHQFAGGYMLDANATWLHRSKWLSTPMDPNIVNPGYGVLALNAGVTSPNGKYRLGVFARNALDKFFYAGRQANNGGWTNVLNPEAVRTVGVNLDVKF
jgi:iron complex outermembrane receptor protein